MTNATAHQPDYRIGLIGSIVGAAALLMVLVQTFAGPFAPQQKIGVTIGEIVVDIHQTIKKKLRHEPLPKPTAKSWNIDNWLVLVSSALAVIAILVGCVALARREQIHLSSAAIALGASAILAKLFIWVALLIAGAIILYAIITNFGDIIGSIGG